MNKVVVVAGPTAVGKTDLGRAIAEKYGGVVVSVDSRQIYRGLDLGTGKDLSFEQKMIDIVEPGEIMSVVEFSRLARREIDNLLSKNRLPVLVGGTGYYLDAILYDKQYPEVENPQLRLRLEHQELSELENQLAELDPASLRRCQGNKRRVVRALEIVLTTKRPVPEQTKNRKYQHLLLVLDPGKDITNRNIEKRLTKRLEQGLLAEVENLRIKVDHTWLRNLGLEYKFLSDFLDGQLSYDDLVDQLGTAIKQYASRQRTWFRRYPEAIWISRPEQAWAETENFLGR